VATLRERGAVVVEPASGRLTGADTGKGRLPEPAELFTLATRLLARGVPTESSTAPSRAPYPDLAGRKVVVTAGGTREPLDPVRFLGNRSSGKQGYAFARTAVARGATVSVIAANVALPDPAGASVVRVETTDQLHRATLAAAGDADVVVMAAAPCDYRPTEYAEEKIKRTGELTLPLVPTVDVAAALGAARAAGQLPAGQLLVAFAAETATGERAQGYARDKLARKGADLIVLNEVGGEKAFGTDTNAATVLDADGEVATITQRSKDELAESVWDLVKPRLTRT
jgi:phosphopantothenoylcysteine decarboxylase/phosphopantothenate--cysteine ligase